MDNYIDDYYHRIEKLEQALKLFEEHNNTIMASRVKEAIRTLEEEVLLIGKRRSQ